MENEINLNKVAETYYNIGWSQGYDQAIEYVIISLKDQITKEMIEDFNDKKFMMDRKERHT